MEIHAVFFELERELRYHLAIEKLDLRIWKQHAKILQI